MTRWEYHFENLVMSEKWREKKQQEENARFSQRLNALGAEGWELISYGPIGLHGSVTKGQKSTMYMAIFKRPIASSDVP